MWFSPARYLILRISMHISGVDGDALPWVENVEADTAVGRSCRVGQTGIDGDSPLGESCDGNSLYGLVRTDARKAKAVLHPFKHSDADPFLLTQSCVPFWSHVAGPDVQAARGALRCSDAESFGSGS
jgi:hypothetical protein